MSDTRVPDREVALPVGEVGMGLSSGTADASECSTDADILAQRYAIERLVDWHLAATRRHERAGRLDPALRHLDLAVRWVRLRPDPVAGHAARCALGLGGGA